jgi:hypothetical protein
MARLLSLSLLSRAAAALALSAGFGLAGMASAADVAPVGLKNRTIAYVVTDARWEMYQTPEGKTECPQGINKFGPRETFKSLFPEGGTVADTHLVRESANWFPQGKEDTVPYYEAVGGVSYGMNLDGKVGPNDFTSPTGEKGVDNQLYRAIGCLNFFRGPTGVLYIFSTKYLRDFDFDRALIELTNVDDLNNDPDVDVTTYRGLDRLMTDATGDQIMPGGTQRVDARFGRKFIRHVKGKIVNGVLTTDPTEAYWPWAIFPRNTASYHFKDLRFSLKVTPTSAEGMMAGYADVDNWYNSLITSYSTHHLGYGQVSAPALYHTLHRLADAYPDETGANTAISTAVSLKFAQVYLAHPPQDVAAVRPAKDIAR